MKILSSPRTRVAEAGSLPDDLPARSQPIAEIIAMSFGLFFPVVGLVAAVVLLWGRGVNGVDLALVLGFYAVTLLGITVGFHRMFTHRGLQAGPTVRFLLGVAGSMSCQGPVMEWCAMHRQHHKHSDRDGDPHSPHLHGDGVAGFFKGMWHAHMGWLYLPAPADIDRSIPDLLADPVLRFVDRLFWFWVLLGWVVPGAIGGLVSGSWMGFLTGFLWGGLVRQFLLHHMTFSVNSVCHVWGTRPFKSADHSRNNAIVGVLTFGEGWHNNHHAFPTSARHGLMWYQLDVSWLFIRAMQAVGLVWNVRLVPESAIEIRRNRPKAERSAEEPVGPIGVATAE